MDKIRKLRQQTFPSGIGVSGEGMDRKVEKKTTMSRRIAYVAAGLLVAAFVAWLVDSLMSGRSLSIDSQRITVSAVSHKDPTSTGFYIGVIWNSMMQPLSPVSTMAAILPITIPSRPWSDCVERIRSYLVAVVALRPLARVQRAYCVTYKSDVHECERD